MNKQINPRSKTKSVPLAAAIAAREKQGWESLRAFQIEAQRVKKEKGIVDWVDDFLIQRKNGL